MSVTARSIDVDLSLRQHGDRLIGPGDADHAVNVVAGGPPEWLRTALRAALEADVSRYPDDRRAREGMATRHGRDPAEIVPTNGAVEALWLLPAALRPSLAVCVHPAFTEAELALRAHGIPTERVLRDPEENFALDVDAVSDAADLVVLGNPASPDGTLEDSSKVLALRRPGRTVVVDEAFMDLVDGPDHSLVREPHGDVVVIRSLTKVLSSPGLRVGYAVATPRLAERLRAVQPPWSTNALALAALEAAARRPDAFVHAAMRVSDERCDLVHRLERIADIRIWPGSANFCLIQVSDGPRVTAGLRARAFAVRPATFPGLTDHYIRLTARSSAENERLVCALEDVLEACR